MWKPTLGCLLATLACGSDSEPTDGPLDECPCGAALSANDLAESYDEKLAEFSTLACNIAGSAFRGECSDGKRLLFIDGGFGHTALYYVEQQLVGTSRSSDVYMQGCPSNSYGGALEDVTCELVDAEALCPSNPSSASSQLSDPLTVPFADGQLSPWCEPQD
jgi:hypothetical protein